MEHITASWQKVTVVVCNPFDRTHDLQWLEDTDQDLTLWLFLDLTGEQEQEKMNDYIIFKDKCYKFNTLIDNKRLNRSFNNCYQYLNKFINLI